MILRSLVISLFSTLLIASPLLAQHTVQSAKSIHDQQEKHRKDVLKELWSCTSRQTVFDYIGFQMSGSVVVLTGFTINGAYKNEAQRRIEKLKWVTHVVNEVEFLPVEPGAQEMRSGALAILQREVPQSFPQNHANIRIKVDKMVITLVGYVESYNKLRYEAALVQIKNLPLVKDVKDEVLITDKK